MAKEQLPKVKITEIANSGGWKPKDVQQKALEIGIAIKSVSSSVDVKDAEDIYNYIAHGTIPPKKAAKIDSKRPEAKKEAKKDAKKDSAKAQSGGEKAAKTKPKAEAKSKDGAKESAKDAAKEGKKDSPKDSPKDSQSPAKAAAATAESTPAESAPKPAPIEALAEEERPKIRQIIIVSKNNAQKSAGESRGESRGAKDSLERLERAKEARDNILHPTVFNAESKKAQKKKQKEVKKVQRQNEQKIDIARNLGDTHIDDEDNEVLLFDLSEMEKSPEEEREEKDSSLASRVRIQRANPWFSDGIAKNRKKRRHQHHHAAAKNAANAANEGKKTIAIPDEIRVYEFAERLNLRVTDIIAKLFKMGEMLTKNDFLDATTIELLAHEFGLDIEISKATQELDYLESSEDSAAEEIIARAPVVTIMGHVDHGKTSLLDYIRKSRVAKSESGGITQHIGAYMVHKNGKDIAFIDTPGHEAFASMRSRGAQVTDIAVIVVAADDGVKQQTKEALNHAKDAQVQVIIAMNKMDKENANPDKLKAEMAELGYNPSDWGGTYDFVPISAKTGQGVEDLLDTILLQAEILELKANIAAQGKAVVLEGSLDKGKGPIVTIMQKEGRLRLGDSVVADTAFGKIRALIKDDGSRANELLPSQVAVLVGLNEVPSAGAVLVAVENDSIAKEYATKRKNYLRTKELSKSTKVSFDELGSVVALGRLKALPLILKADTQGSLEALRVSLEALSNDEVRVNIIASSVGNITESDIATAAGAKNCHILGFNVKPLSILKTHAKEQGVPISSHAVIYALVDEVKEIIAAMMSPIVSEETIGSLEVREVFNVGKDLAIAGCFVLDGLIERGAKVRLLRKDKEIFLGNIASLKRFKDDVKEVAKGFECGVMLENFNDIKVGDSIVALKEVAKAARYEDSRR